MKKPHTAKPEIAPAPAAAGSTGLVCSTLPGGVEFAVLATPGSAKAGVRGVHGTALKVALRSPPEKGRANEELLEILAAWLEVPERQVRLVRGATSRQKRIQVNGLDVAALQRKAATMAAR